MRDDFDRIVFFCLMIWLLFFVAAIGRVFINLGYQKNKVQTVQIHEPASAWSINNKNEDDRFIFYQIQNKKQNFHFLIVKEKNGRSVVSINLGAGYG